MRCDMVSDQETDTSYTMDTIFSVRFKRRTPRMQKLSVLVMMSLLLMVFMTRDAGGVEAKVSSYYTILFYYLSGEHWGYHC